MYSLIYLELICSVCKKPLEGFHRFIGDGQGVEVKPCENCKLVEEDSHVGPADD